ncbi:MAG: hypothetical protein M1814_004495 [Vezdaea aestivalis]|nr:MAG: hypothetical protein M1814_004495 [Vezdaea aestivalis]
MKSSSQEQQTLREQANQPCDNNWIYLYSPLPTSTNGFNAHDSPLPGADGARDARLTFEARFKKGGNTTPITVYLRQVDIFTQTDYFPQIHILFRCLPPTVLRRLPQLGLGKMWVYERRPGKRLVDKFRALQKRGVINGEHDSWPLTYLNGFHGQPPPERLLEWASISTEAVWLFDKNSPQAASPRQRASTRISPEASTQRSPQLKLPDFDPTNFEVPKVGVPVPDPVVSGAQDPYQSMLDPNLDITRPESQAAINAFLASEMAPNSSAIDPNLCVTQSPYLPTDDPDLWDWDQYLQGPLSTNGLQSPTNWTPEDDDYFAINPPATSAPALPPLPNPSSAESLPANDSPCGPPPPGLPLDELFSDFVEPISGSQPNLPQNGPPEALALQPGFFANAEFEGDQSAQAAFENGPFVGMSFRNPFAGPVEGQPPRWPSFSDAVSPKSNPGRPNSRLSST